MVNLKLVEIALEHAVGSVFEQFFHSFYPALAGIEFVPLGGVHDGGADAFQGMGLYEGVTGRAGTFYQASVQQDHRAKIRQTMERLREFGRDPVALYYFTSKTVGLIDQEEEKLSEELDVTIKIRDRKWIAANINGSPQTAAAFETYLRPCIAFLTEPGSANLVGTSSNISARTMCVFLGQEVDRRRGKTDLLEAVTDTLILWALEGTDPELDRLMTRNDILRKIEGAMPSAKQFIRGVFNHRIELLARKGNSTGREVRWHKKEDRFALPYETRQLIETENADDEYLKLQVLDTYGKRAADLLAKDESELLESIPGITHRSLELTFEKEGLELAAFLSGSGDENYYVALSDQVDEALAESGIVGASATTAKEVVLAVLRQAFYNSTDGERIYYGKLSRTYTLMLTLSNEPKIVEYFKGMSSDFVLFIGTDIIVRALSERYLPAEDQMTTNMLRILVDAGSKLVLTEMVVEEVHAHLAATDLEFRNWFMELEPYVDLEIARHCSKILVRAYFYARFDPLLGSRPAGWKSFIGQICNYDKLHSKKTSRDEIKKYLVEKFGFEYLSRKSISKITDPEEVKELAEKIMKIKSEEVLAKNDALQILSVYGRRHTLREDHRPNPYGYRTWWLTHETRVRQCTGELVQNRGSQYIIRPEFILNFVSLSPTTAEVRNSYGTVFPTLLGVRLSNRMRDEVFHDVMLRAKEMQSVDEARARVMMSGLSDRLKGDNFKQYETDFASGRLDAT